MHSYNKHGFVKILVNIAVLTIAILAITLQLEDMSPFPLFVWTVIAILDHCIDRRTSNMIYFPMYTYTKPYHLSWAWSTDILNVTLC